MIHCPKCDYKYDRKDIDGKSYENLYGTFCIKCRAFIPPEEKSPLEKNYDKIIEKNKKQVLEFLKKNIK